MWLGYLAKFQDDMCHHESLHELKENLKDIYHELNSGNIPCVRRFAELKVAIPLNLDPKTLLGENLLIRAGQEITSGGTSKFKQIYLYNSSHVNPF